MTDETREPHLAGMLERSYRNSMVGRRLRLVRSTDEYTLLKPGDEGVVRLVDDIGTLHVNWDSGSRLGLVPGEDSWEWLEP